MKDMDDNYYKELYGKIKNYLISCGMEPDNASDITQEVFVRMAKHKDELIKDEHKISGWSFMVAKHLRDSFYRDNKRMVYVPEIKDEDDTRAPYKFDYKRFDRDYRKNKVECALVELPDRLKETIKLFYYENCSIRDISNKLGISECLVKVRLNRGRNKMKDIIKKNYKEVEDGQ